MTSPRKSNAPGSSSANIFKSLSNSNITVQNEEKGRLIYIPQKCYGIIDINTSKMISGFYTTGLNTCSGIVAIAYSKDNNSVYFCHADTRTNLVDNTHGLPGWINNLPSHIANIELTYDDVQYHHFKNMILQLEILTNKSSVSRHITSHPSKSNSTDMLVLRNGEIKYGGGVFFDYEDNGYEIHSESKIEDKINLLVEHHDKNHGPICLFDGTHIRSIDEIYKAQPWVKNAIEEAATIEYYAEDIRELDITRSILFPEENISNNQETNSGPKRR